MAALALALGAAGCPQPQRDAAPPPAPLSSEAQEERDALYALGGWLARNLAGLKIEEKDLAPIEEGLSDALLGRTLRVDPTAVGERVQKLINDRRAATAADEKRAGAALLADAKRQPGAERTVSGLVYLSLAEGHGESPALTDQVRLFHRGTRRDGSILDDSYARGRPEVFALTRVIPCWSEALQRMRPGGKAKISCPSDLAYGDRGLPGSVLPGAPLQFELELLEIVPATPK